MKKIDASGTTVFVYNAGAQLIAEYHSDPVPPAAGGGGTSYLTTDHLGSTRVVTKQDGTVKARYDYVPFGEELGSGIGGRTVGMGYSAADSTKQKFTRKERDSESGLYYFLARYYSSAQGRFASPDEFVGGPDELYDFAEEASNNPTFYADLVEPQSLNKYQYCYNNPLAYVDPSGHQARAQLREQVRVEYEQSTGRLTVRDQNNNVLRTEDGYAGHGQGVNNPDRQGERNVGPVPRGEYNIGPAENHPTTGPVSLRLTPSANTDTEGRSGFLIHGNNARGDRSASQGCIVVSRTTRELINGHGGGTLTVVRGPAQNQQAQPANQGQPAAGNPIQRPPQRSPQQRHQQVRPRNPDQQRRPPQGNPPPRQRDQRQHRAP